jgi:peptidoglycan hydrolase-like protein with peptidoglycan-binding domain
MDPKLLTEDRWKAVAQKFKVKDKELQKALCVYEFIDDEEYDDRLKELSNLNRLASGLKKSKEIASQPEVVKYLTDFLNTVQTVVRDVTKAKASSAKDAITQKKAEAAAKEEDEEEEEDEESDYPKRLLQAFAKLKGAKDVAYQFLVCDTKPFPTLALAKRITPKHKQELMDMTEGSKRFLKVGSCMFQDGKFNFVMDEPITGLARKLQASIKNFTGKKLPIVVGSETAEEEEEQSGAEVKRPLENAANPVLPKPRGGGLAISGSVGRGGKNLPQDVMAVQTALNNRIKAGLNVDGKCTPQTIAAIETFQKNLGQFKPDGRVDPGRGSARALAGTGPLPPPPPAPAPIAPPKLGKPELAKAPEVWHGTRKILDTNIKELKKGVKAHYGSEHSDLLTEIDASLVKLDGIMEKLDDKLAHSLAKAHAAKDPAARAAELKTSKVILADYIKYVKSEPMIAHIDSNPFGVQTNLKKVLTDSLMHMAQSIG